MAAMGQDQMQHKIFSASILSVVSSGKYTNLACEIDVEDRWLLQSYLLHFSAKIVLST